MIEWLTEPFAQGIGLRALVEVVIVGIACGPLGVWIVLNRQAYAAESIAHSMLPGLVLAALIGAPLGVGAAVGLVLAAAAITLAMRLRDVSSDVAVAAVVTTMVAIGTLAALAPQTPARLGELLFGNPLSVQAGEIVLSAIVACVLVGILFGVHRPLTLSTFDPDAARSLGVRGGHMQLALLGLIGLATLAAVQALGNLLVVALLIAPAAAALILSRRLTVALPAAAALAALAGLTGLIVSYRLDIAAGAAIAIIAVLEAALAAAFAHVGSLSRTLSRPGSA